jgi:hypothetical protein
MMKPSTKIEICFISKFHILETGRWNLACLRLLLATRRRGQDRVENLVSSTHKYSPYRLGGTEWPDDATFDRGHIPFATTFFTLKILYISNTSRVHRVWPGNNVYISVQ